VAVNFLVLGHVVRMKQSCVLTQVEYKDARKAVLLRERLC
jgi:hypothetical protein